MTHDKLLAKIDTLEARYTDYSSYLALRAVVELHTETEDGYCAWCYLCNYERTGLYMDNAMYSYPCPTIQAIEKELMWATKVQ